LRFSVQDLRVQGFRVFGFRIQGLVLRVWGLGFGVKGLALKKIQGLGYLMMPFLEFFPLQ
jgi:hypothetical protein